MLDFPFEAQLAIAIVERLAKLSFQAGQTVNLLAYVRQLTREYWFALRNRRDAFAVRPAVL